MYYNRKFKKSQKKKVRLQKNIYVIAFEMLTLLNMMWCSAASSSLTVFYIAEIICLVALVIYKLHFKFEGNELYKKSGIHYVDTLSDTDFKVYLQTLCKEQGYTVKDSPCDNVDFNIVKDKKVYAFKSKLSPIKIGTDIVADLTYQITRYNYAGGYLITNNYPSPQAQMLATHSNITIINRTQLAEHINNDDVLSFVSSSLCRNGKRCPYCGARLELNNSRTRYVCKNRPKCKFAIK